MENTTKIFRNHVIERQITSSEVEIGELQIKMKGITESLYQNISETQITEIQHKLTETLQNHELKQKIKINQKLNHVYQGRLFLPNTNNKYIIPFTYQTH